MSETTFRSPPTSDSKETEGFVVHKPDVTTRVFRKSEAGLFALDAKAAVSDVAGLDNTTALLGHNGSG